ncbi:hypothetical protein Sjap_016839 [Stephania japonica]|uniref:Protein DETOXIFICATION n=1 Tax=Stephania japonica TaxID=461633 RepID=A0AAP0I511_9MAGN
MGERRNDELGKMWEKSWEESKKVWHIAGPTILTSLAQFSVNFATIAFVGHLGDLELAAVSIVQSVIEGFAFAVMLGMGSALETLCGQAVGAGKLNMLGIYMQRSWIITCVTGLFLLPIYIFASPLLKLLHQSHPMSNLAGKYCIWVIPQLFAYAVNFPLEKFFQSQSKVWVMAIISMVVFAIHILLGWLLVFKLGHGLVGAAIVGNVSWCLLAFTLLVYAVSGRFRDAWTGFSLSAFKSLSGFVKLSLASAIMVCLEFWYYTAMILLVGRLKNPEIAVGAISICVNLHLWTMMIALGFNIAVSVRVSNELGAGNPSAAKFSVVVAAATSMFFAIIFCTTILRAGNHIPKLFTDKPLVVKETSKLHYLLASTILLNGILPVLNGVAVGAGWQFQVALISIACYYIFGIPFGALLAFRFNLGVQGIWSGMVAGAFLLTVILVFIILYRTNWHKEALQAEERIKRWGGPAQTQLS